MYPLNALIAGWLSLALWSVPEPDYMAIWFADALRSDVLPQIPGI